MLASVHIHDVEEAQRFQHEKSFKQVVLVSVSILVLVVFCLGRFNYCVVLIHMLDKYLFMHFQARLHPLTFESTLLSFKLSKIIIEPR